MPAGHSLSAGSTAGDKAENTFGKWSLTVTPPDKDRTARLIWECSILPAVLPPDKERNFIDFAHASLRRLQADWSFTADTVVSQ